MPGKAPEKTAQALLTDKVYYGCLYSQGAHSMSAKPAVKPAAKPTRAAARSKPEPAVTTSASIDAQVAAFLASGGEIQTIPAGTSGQTYGGPRARAAAKKA